jgi:hypothetical protein
MTAQSVAAPTPGEKFKFVEKRQWKIPRQSFILIKLSEKKSSKLAKWLKNSDTVYFNALPARHEIMLWNESMHERRRKRKHV